MLCWCISGLFKLAVVALVLTPFKLQAGLTSSWFIPSTGTPHKQPLSPLLVYPLLQQQLLRCSPSTPCWHILFFLCSSLFARGPLSDTPSVPVDATLPTSHTESYLFLWCGPYFQSTIFPIFQSCPHAQSTFCNAIYCYSQLSLTFSNAIQMYCQFFFTFFQCYPQLQLSTCTISSLHGYNQFPFTVWTVQQILSSHILVA